MEFNALFSFTAFVIGLILIGIVLYRHKHPSARFLAFFLFTLASSNFFIFLYESKYLLHVPFLFRIGAPVTYLIAPAMLFYILFALNKKQQLSWRDTCHLLPVLFFLIDYFPLYISSNAVKKQIIESLFQNVPQAMLCKEGWIMPPGWHYFLRHFIAFLYALYAGRLLYKEYHSEPGKYATNQSLLTWMKVVIGLILLLSVMGMITYFFTYSPLAWTVTVWEPLLIFTTLGLMLFAKPEILYGSTAISSPITEDKEVKSLVLSPETIRKVQAKLNGFLEDRKFLRKNIRLKEVAEELDIQPYILSAYVNQVYLLRFNDLINQSRVQYMVNDGLLNSQENTLTLEAIAETAGFTNRTTFLNAFKKFTGMTPTDFLHQKRAASLSENGHPDKNQAD
jgi:AraC-like DNA-binding protein